MSRVSEDTRNGVQQIAREDRGASANEVIRHLLDEHWEAQAVAAVEHYRKTDPQGWADYLSEADESASAEAPVTDEWTHD